MLAQIKSCGLLGVEGILVTVEVDINNGLPGYAVVGLPDAGIKESKERVFSALKNSGLRYPLKRITVNLAPADLRKRRSGLRSADRIGAFGRVGAGACGLGRQRRVWRIVA